MIPFSKSPPPNLHFPVLDDIIEKKSERGV